MEYLSVSAVDITNDLFTWTRAHTRDVANAIRRSSLCRVCLSSALECTFLLAWCV